MSGSASSTVPDFELAVPGLVEVEDDADLSLEEFADAADEPGR
jgi:hypothetical protein